MLASYNNSRSLDITFIREVRVACLNMFHCTNSNVHYFNGKSEFMYGVKLIYFVLIQTICMA